MGSLLKYRSAPGKGATYQAHTQIPFQTRGGKDGRFNSDRKEATCLSQYAVINLYFMFSLSEML